MVAWHTCHASTADTYQVSDILILASDKTFHGIYVFGDLNLYLLHHNDDTAVREFINLMYAFSLFSLTT